MKHYLFWLLTLFGSSSCFAQIQTEGVGNLMIAELGDQQALSLDLTCSGEPFVFSDGMDYSDSKVLPGYFRLRVKAPALPWIVTATVDELYLGSETGATTEDFARLVSLRSAAMGYSVRLSGSPQIILQSTNTLSENEFTIDMIIDPPFNFPSGSYLFMVNFQLQLQ